jgi:hypothetical protein
MWPAVRGRQLASFCRQLASLCCPVWAGVLKEKKTDDEEEHLISVFLGV